MGKKLPQELWNEIGVLVTAHPRQQKFWDQAFASWAGFPHYMLMGNDDDTWGNIPIERYIPPVSEIFLTQSPAGQLGHFRGELEQLKLGAQILKGRGKRFFYKTAADNTCYRWRNIPFLHKTLKKFDLLICGTTQMFGKVDSLIKVMDLWHPKLRSGGAELYVYSQIREHDIKVRYEKAPFWNTTLGLIHIQGECALNQDTNVMRTWINGQKWGTENTHRDLTPKRLELLKSQRLIYPNEGNVEQDTVSKDEEERR